MVRRSLDPAYGQPAGDLDLEDSSADVVVDVEMPAADWHPLVPPAGIDPAESVVFIDGVRRVDARAWIHGPSGGLASGLAGGGTESPALCATYGAGAVRCDRERATIVAVLIERGLFSAAAEAADVETRSGTYFHRPVGSPKPEALTLALQARMGELEMTAAATPEVVGRADLLVVDGPLRGRGSDGRGHIANAIGFVKTHHVAYLPGPQHAVAGALAPGQRTPVFRSGVAFPRLAWYLRLPGGGGTPWAGIVRVEAAAGLSVADVVALADRTTLTLGRFASEPHKDKRAPQNLYPIAGLERELRRRLGDEALLYRSLRRAAA